MIDTCVWKLCTQFLRLSESRRLNGSRQRIQSYNPSEIIDGKWDSAPKSYLPVRNELTFIGHVILRGTRIVDPQSRRKRVVSLAHEGHQGVVKTKERLRPKVWWPGMDRDTERCAECYGCQLVTSGVSQTTMGRSGNVSTRSITV